MKISQAVDFHLQYHRANSKKNKIKTCEFVLSRFTSQLLIDHWHEQIGDPTLADSILDRLVHSAHQIKLNGESMRKKHANFS